jgi:carotenoid cleavage dioxygenase-like enzyme
MMGVMAHAQVDESNGVLTGAMGCSNPDDFGATGHYHIVFTIDPAKPLERRLLAKIHLGRLPSYMHAFASTPNYVVLIANPLYMSLKHALAGMPLGEGSIITTSENTIFHIVERKTGKVTQIEAPGFIFGHIINSWEEKDGGISIDLTWYGADNSTTLGWFNRWFFKYMSDPAVREQWPRSQVKRYTLKPREGKADVSTLFADERGLNDFETPKINEAFNGKAHCIVYMTQFHSYDYSKDQRSLDSGPFGAVGTAKRNVCTGERMGWYSANEYPSEVQFVANPSGTDEDDGVLLGIVFNGNTNLSYFHVLDAKTMKQVARAELPIKIPFLVHSSFFPPDEGSKLEESLVV